MLLTARESAHAPTLRLKCRDSPGVIPKSHSHTPKTVPTELLARSSSLKADQTYKCSRSAICVIVSYESTQVHAQRRSHSGVCGYLADLDLEIAPSSVSAWSPLTLYPHHVVDNTDQASTKLLDDVLHKSDKKILTTKSFLLMCK